MLTPRQGRFLVFALIVHFALLLPAADLAHGSAHPDDASCDVCLQLGSFQHGVAPTATCDTPQPLAATPLAPLSGAVDRAAPARAMARGPPFA